jgi:endonuclease/exonuclease/phosphatase (EEP) superfamily protein YafD
MEEPTRTAPKPKASRLRRLLVPTSSRRARPFVIRAWLVVLVSYPAVLFAYMFPQDFRNSSSAYVAVATAAFMIRTFLFQAGLLWCVSAAIGVLARSRRVALGALPLVQNRDTAGIVAEVLAERPDVLVLLEYRSHWHEAFQPALAAEYPHMHCTIQEDNFGLAIYSRRPFVGPVDMDLRLGSIGLPQARAVIQLDGRDVALYCVHLAPPGGIWSTTEQRHEFADLLEQLKQETLPVVLCGDFNFTNRSVFADALERLGLIDVHRISGRGRGTTWCRIGLLRWLPGIRLDHIFLSKELTSPRCATGVGRGSDHRPVMAEVGFKK